MKLFGKLLIAALVIGMMLPFTVLKGKDGRALMSFSDLKIPDLGGSSLPKSNPLKAGDGNSTIYQWKDNDGNIQFTSSPPPAGVEYTVKGYDPNTNVIQSVKLPESESKETGKKDEIAPPDGITSVYSPEKINKLFDDAKNVEKLLNDRLKQQKAAIGD